MLLVGNFQTRDHFNSHFSAFPGSLECWCFFSDCFIFETWPVRKENEVALQRAEMRMVRWMCSVKVKDRVRSKELRESLGIDYIILVLQQNR